jgi:hypothetical protein
MSLNQHQWRIIDGQSSAPRCISSRGDDQTWMRGLVWTVYTLAAFVRSVARGRPSTTSLMTAPGRVGSTPLVRRVGARRPRDTRPSTPSVVKLLERSIVSGRLSPSVSGASETVSACSRGARTIRERTQPSEPPRRGPTTPHTRMSVEHMAAPTLAPMLSRFEQRIGVGTRRTNSARSSTCADGGPTTTKRYCEQSTVETNVSSRAVLCICGTSGRRSVITMATSVCVVVPTERSSPITLFRSARAGQMPSRTFSRCANRATLQRRIGLPTIDRPGSRLEHFLAEGFHARNGRAA